MLISLMVPIVSGLGQNFLQQTNIQPQSTTPNLNWNPEPTQSPYTTCRNEIMTTGCDQLEAVCKATLGTTISPFIGK